MLLKAPMYVLPRFRLQSITARRTWLPLRLSREIFLTRRQRKFALTQIG